jgi:carbohydrate-selective porin OprB
VAFDDPTQNIPPVSGLLYTTIFANGTLLGGGRHPGQFGIGLWRHTGQLTAPGGITPDSAGGVYLSGSQRVAFGLNDRVPASPISVFYQFGVNDSQTLPVNQHYGAGLTTLGLIGDRGRDSMGFGVGVSRPNANLFARSTEVMQAYYQAHVVAAIFNRPSATFQAQARWPTPRARWPTPRAR